MVAVVFLRGMNLGNRRITNDTLTAAFERLGCVNPTPYRASGNVILPAVSDIDPKELAAGLNVELGFEVPVFVRSAQQLRTIASSPFAGQRGDDDGQPQIILLSSEPASLEGVFGPDDRFEVLGTEIHWLPPGGLAETGDLHKRLDRAVGPNTVRTLGTIERIAKKLPASD